MKYISFFIIVGTLTIISCQKDNPFPPEEQPQVNLTLEDVSCTEAWIKLTTVNISLPAEVTLKRGENITFTISLTGPDTLLYINSLLPNHLYKFQSVIQSTGQSSNSVSVTTLDTSSDRFTWQSWMFGGQAGHCELNDVAIINENNIWAVGAVYLLDTLGQPDPDAYNAVHWNGSELELKRIKYYGSCSTVKYPHLYSIWALSDSEIVLTNGGSIGWFNGDTVKLDCGINPLLTGAIRKIWGRSKNDFYAVGNNGNIEHFDGYNWNRLESGTTGNIYDIWGKEGNGKIFCAASSGNVENKILTISENNKVDSLKWNGKIVKSVWTKDDRIIYTSGDGIYNNKSGSWVAETFSQFHYTNKIRGNDLNDIFACGNYGFLTHFNGSEWTTYQEVVQMSITQLYTVSCTPYLVAAVGYKSTRAVLVLGRR